MLGFEHHSPSIHSASRWSISPRIHVAFEYNFCCIIENLQIGEKKSEQESDLVKSVFAFFYLELLSLFLRRTSASCLVMTDKDVATALQQWSVGETRCRFL